MVCGRPMIFRRSSEGDRGGKVHMDDIYGCAPDLDVLEQLEKAFELTKTLGGDFELTVTPGEPVTENHPEVTKRIQDSYKKLFPYFELLDRPFGLEGEDFGHVTQRVPGAIFFVGAGYETPGATRDLHTPNFGIDERCLPVVRPL